MTLPPSVDRVRMVLGETLNLVTIAPNAVISLSSDDDAEPEIAARPSAVAKSSAETAPVVDLDDSVDAAAADVKSAVIPDASLEVEVATTPLITDEDGRYHTAPQVSQAPEPERPASELEEEPTMADVAETTTSAHGKVVR